MFGVSFTELVVVFLIALLLFGPEQLPQMARQLGKLMAELRKGSDAVRREFYNTVYPPAQELTKDFTAASKDLRALKSEFLQTPKLPSVGDIVNDVKNDLAAPLSPIQAPPGGGRAAVLTEQRMESSVEVPQESEHRLTRSYDDDKGDA